MLSNNLFGKTCFLNQKLSTTCQKKLMIQQYTSLFYFLVTFLILLFSSLFCFVFKTKFLVSSWFNVWSIPCHQLCHVFNSSHWTLNFRVFTYAESCGPLICVFSNFKHSISLGINQRKKWSCVRVYLTPQSIISPLWS